MKIPVCEPMMTGHEVAFLKTAIRENSISGSSPFVKAFENKIVDYCGSKYGMATNSGTTALHLALKALKIGFGDEVIMPTFTMAACAFAVCYTGAKPVFVDADAETWCMDTSKVESEITPRTKAVMAAHIYGHPTNMYDLWARIPLDSGIAVIEDAAEGLGASIDPPVFGRTKAGSLGTIGCFSFYANKVITTGEGGMCITNDKVLADRIAWLRAQAFGKSGPKRYIHPEIGFGYRMSGLQAAMGLGQMMEIDNLIERRRSHAKQYNEELGSIDELVLPVEKPWAKNAYWMYSVRTKKRKHRDQLMAYLEKYEIESRPFFYPMHRQPFLAEQIRDQRHCAIGKALVEGKVQLVKELVSGMSSNKSRYPVSDVLSATGMNLPSGSGLKEGQISEVCNHIKAFFKEVPR